MSGGFVDSFSLARIGVFVEEAFGLSLPDSALGDREFDTLNQMVEVILRWAARGSG